MARCSPRVARSALAAGEGPPTLLAAGRRTPPPAVPLPITPAGMLPGERCAPSSLLPLPEVPSPPPSPPSSPARCSPSDAGSPIVGACWEAVDSFASGEIDGLAAEGLAQDEDASWAHAITLSLDGVLVKPPHAARASNAVRTARYTWLSWLPKSLLLQFRRAANAWALLIGVLAAVLGDNSPQAPELILIILSIILLWTSIRELFDDLHRLRADLACNSCPTRRYCGETRTFVDIERQDCALGDLLLVRGGEQVPADLLLVGSSDARGVCYVSTSSLDGERHLKQRSIPGVLRGSPGGGSQGEEAAASAILASGSEIRLQRPCMDLSVVSCSLVVGGKPLRADCDNFLLRGSRVDATDWVLGITCYVGAQTKARLNAINVQSKVSYMQRKLNFFIVCTLLTILLISCLWSLMGQIVELSLDEWLQFREGEFDFQLAALRFTQYLIILYPVVPLTMYVNYELLQLALVRGFQGDKEMCGGDANLPVEVRTSDLIEELGQVNYVFSDKTGTLTANDMRFAACCIGQGPPCIADGHSLQPDGARGGAVSADDDAARDFFELLAACHTVQMSADGQFQGESPDEVALVEGAATFGFALRSREQTGEGEVLQLDTPSGPRSVRVSQVLAFTSERRRMSVVCPDSASGGAVVLTKGADSAMEQLLAQPLPPAAQGALEEFARRGLRTLVVGRGRMPKAVYAKWRQQWAKADASMHKREERLGQLARVAESGLEFVGVSAVEDRLQQEVPETLCALRAAGVGVWVLTGDKVSTAIEIAHSCMLFDQSMTILRVVATQSVEHTAEAFRVSLNDARVLGGATKQQSLGLVVDGQAVQHAMENNDVGELLYQLGTLCVACVACRMSPRQKEQLVRLVTRESGFHERRQFVVLAIGDGANDVPMIQSANVGIGLRGKEGTAAVQACDVAVSEFRCLRRLLFCHGRDSYRILALFLCWFLYKNLLLAWANILYAPGNSFEGRPAYPPALVNCPIWTFIVLPVFASDRETDYSASLENPELYKLGIQRTYFNFWVVTEWMFLASWHGIVAWVIPIYTFTTRPDRLFQTDVFWKASLTSFTAQLAIANLKLLISLSRPRRKSALGPVVGAMVAYVVFVFLVSYLLQFLDSSIAGLALELFTSWPHVLCMLLLPPAALLPDGLLALARRLLLSPPSPHAGAGAHAGDGGTGHEDVP